jgi:hypothetical protein
MTSFFDEWARDHCECQFLDDAKAVEAPLLAIVNLATGDREFPDDLREKAQGIIACWALSIPNPSPKAIELFRVTGGSRACDDLHSLFHEVGSRRVDTRFGLLSDSPSQIVVLRDDHDGGSDA